MRDFVQSDNITELVKEAEQLSLKELIVITRSKLALPESTLKLSTAYYVQEKEFSKLPKLKNQFDYVLADGTRQAFESKHVDFILPLLDAPQDHTHYRNGGMDQILAKLARDKKKTILIDLSALRKAKNREQVLGRMLQNVRLCKKYKVSYEIATFAADVSELKSGKDLEAMKRSLT